MNGSDEELQATGKVIKVSSTFYRDILTVQALNVAVHSMPAAVNPTVWTWQLLETPTQQRERCKSLVNIFSINQILEGKFQCI